MKALTKVSTVDEYIDQFPTSTKKILKQIRNRIKKILPDAIEVIAYGIPTFKLKQNIVHFAGYENHIGFYPGAQTITDFKAELKSYKWAKGSVQFQLDEPIPYDLISAMTIQRLKNYNEYIKKKAKSTSKK